MREHTIVCEIKQLGASSGVEENYDENRNPNDIKLIVTLKKKMKVLKEAYLEEHNKTTTLQKELDSLLIKKNNLEEALTEKEAICAKLNREILQMKDAAATSPIRQMSLSNPIRGDKSGLEASLSQTKKENEELKEQMELLKQNLAINEKMITGVKDALVERMQELTNELNLEKEKVKNVEKERDEAKENAVKCEELCRINFDQRAYWDNVNIGNWKKKLII